MSSKVEFKTELTIADVISQLKNISDGLNDGAISIDHASDSITLRPKEKVLLKVKASKKKDRDKLSFKISWKH